MGDSTSPNLFGEGPPPPVQRTSATSVAAAEAKKPTATKQRAEVLDFIRRFGPLTDEAGAKLSDISPNSWRPRRRELEQAGLVVADGVAQVASGRKATVWRAPGPVPAPPYEGADWSELAKRRPGWMGRAAFLDLVSKAVAASNGDLQAAQRRVGRDLEALR